MVLTFPVTRIQPVKGKSHTHSLNFKVKFFRGNFGQRSVQHLQKLFMKKRPDHVISRFISFTLLSCGLCCRVSAPERPRPVQFDRVLKTALSHSLKLLLVDCVLKAAFIESVSVCTADPLELVAFPREEKLALKTGIISRWIPSTNQCTVWNQAEAELMIITVVSGMQSNHHALLDTHGFFRV